MEYNVPNKRILEEAKKMSFWRRQRGIFSENTNLKAEAL